MDFHYIDYNLLYNKEIIDKIELDISCVICKGILNEPKMCLNCQNNFCSVCIESICNMNNGYKNVKVCPFRCDNKKFVKNVLLNKILSKICKFHCEFGCDEIISYSEINNHFNKCKNNDLKKKEKYEDLLAKFNWALYKNRNLCQSIENKKLKITKLNEEYHNYLNLKEQKENYKQLKYDYKFFIKFNTNPIIKEQLNDDENIFDYKIKGNKGKNKRHKKNKNKNYNKKLQKSKEKMMK